MKFVTTAEEATRLIEYGRSALLPEGAWDLAAEVLRHFGLNDGEIAQRFAMACGRPQTESWGHQGILELSEDVGDVRRIVAAGGSW